MDHGYAQSSLERVIVEARKVLERLSRLGIDLSAMTPQLKGAGVMAFAESHAAPLETYDRKATGSVRTAAS